MRQGALEGGSIVGEKGVTLIELLVVLVISAIVIGGVYRVFVLQTKAYTVQDQVAELQQDVRGAMEIMVRDIRMAGFQTNSFALTNPTASLQISGNQIVTPLNSSSIQVSYEYIPLNDPNCNNKVGGVSDCVTYQVTYSLVTAVSPSCPTPPCLQHLCTQTPAVAGSGCTGTPDILLTNVRSLNFSYGVDANGDGIIDGLDTATGIIPDDPNDPNYPFQSAANVNGNPSAKILAVRVQLSAKPTSTDPDVTTTVSPRTLTSVVIPRNIFFRRYQAY